MRRLWVVSYDVADHRRRVHLAQWLAGQGDRVLESVFECVWRADELPHIQTTLTALINPAEDRLWLVPVCQRCQTAAVASGQQRAAVHCTHHVV